MTTESAPSNQRFGRRLRLRGRRNFAGVFRRKCSAGNSELVVYVAPNNLEHARLGIIVSRKVGNAVARARVRRQIREFFRKAKQKIPAGYDYTCIAKPNAKKEWVLTPDATAELFAGVVKKLSRNSRR